MNNPWRAAAWLLVGASLILALSLGVRHGFGLFLSPMSSEYGWGREVFAFAIALQNLIWGLAQPITGAIADRFGARRVIVAGGVLYASGLALMAGADSASSLSLSAGLLIGIGLSGTSFSVLLGVVGRALPPEKRSIGMGIAAAAGSFGQFAMLPGTLGLIGWLGWSSALLALAMLVALIAPLALMVRDIPLSAPAGAEQSLGAALKEACSHSGFWLLALGFFVCGFQVFIGVHLPSYLVDQHLPATLVGPLSHLNQPHALHYPQIAAEGAAIQTQSLGQGRNARPVEALEITQQGKLGDIEPDISQGIIVDSAHTTAGTAQFGTEASGRQHEYRYIPASTDQAVTVAQEGSGTDGTASRT